MLGKNHIQEFIFSWKLTNSSSCTQTSRSSAGCCLCRSCGRTRCSIWRKWGGRRIFGSWISLGAAGWSNLGRGAGETLQEHGHRGPSLTHGPSAAAWYLRAWTRHWTSFRGLSQSSSHEAHQRVESLASVCPMIFSSLVLHQLEKKREGIVRFELFKEKLPYQAWKC